MKRRAVVWVLVAAAAGAVLVRVCGRGCRSQTAQRVVEKLPLVGGTRSVEEAVEEVAPDAAARLQPYFAAAGVAYPPPRLTLVALKEEKQLEVWADSGGRWVRIRTYPILAASGHAGPKLREGDRQVPEGIYRIVYLNPNSSYHLSMLLDYPNDFDRRMAEADGRTNLGGDICIHGRNASIGCLAMGDEAIEELFTLVERVGPANVTVLIAPCEMRGRPEPVEGLPADPPWTAELYAALARELQPFAP